MLKGEALYIGWFQNSMKYSMKLVSIPPASYSLVMFAAISLGSQT